MIPTSSIHNFLDGLPDAVQTAFDAVSTHRRFGKSRTIIQAGDRRDVLYQLCEGSVKYCARDERGREMVAAFMKPGDWIGLSELFTGMPAMADVVALSPVRLRVLKRRDFEALMARYPVIAQHLLRVFSLRFSVMYYAAQDRSALTLKERLIKTLYTLSFSTDKQEADGKDLVIRMSQEELSRVLASSRQRVNRALKELEREGLLRLGYGAIRLGGRAPLLGRYGRLVRSGGAPAALAQLSPG